MEPTELREAIAAALYFYQTNPPDRVGGHDVPARVFDARAALAEWGEWVAASEARGLTASVKGHRAAADRVVAMCVTLWGRDRLGLPAAPATVPART